MLASLSLRRLDSQWQKDFVTAELRESSGPTTRFSILRRKKSAPPVCLLCVEDCLSAASTRYSLLLRIQDPQNEAAWGEFVSLYEPLVYGLARRQGLQDADARDLCQDVFRAVAKAAGRFKPNPAQGSFRTWLFRIARNLMLNLLRRNRRHVRGSGDSEIQRMLESQLPGDEQRRWIGTIAADCSVSRPSRSAPAPAATSRSG
jgi:hypothetical protein